MSDRREHDGTNPFTAVENSQQLLREMIDSRKKFANPYPIAPLTIDRMPAMPYMLAEGGLGAVIGFAVGGLELALPGGVIGLFTGALTYLARHGDGHR